MSRLATSVRPQPGSTDGAAVAKLSIVVGVALATSLMILALWAWQQAGHIAIEVDRPELVRWAVRCAAVAAAAMAQAVLLILVIGNVYRTRTLDLALRFLTAGVFAVALVSAIALGLASR